MSVQVGTYYRQEGDQAALGGMQLRGRSGGGIWGGWYKGHSGSGAPWPVVCREAPHCPIQTFEYICRKAHVFPGQ